MIESIGEEKLPVQNHLCVEASVCKGTCAHKHLCANACANTLLFVRVWKRFGVYKCPCVRHALFCTGALSFHRCGDI